MLTVGQEVTAWVLNVDEEKKRFGLSLKEPRAAGAEEEDAGGAGAGVEGRGKVATRAAKPRADRADKKPITVKRGDWVEGTVLTVLPYGAVVEVEEGVSGLLHVSEMSGTCAARPHALACCCALPVCHARTRLTHTRTRHTAYATRREPGGASGGHCEG
jgi:ribosomal protein S1